MSEAFAGGHMGGGAAGMPPYAGPNGGPHYFNASANSDARGLPYGYGASQVYTNTYPAQVYQNQQPVYYYGGHNITYPSHPSPAFHLSSQPAPYYHLGGGYLVFANPQFAQSPVIQVHHHYHTYGSAQNPEQQFTMPSTTRNQVSKEESELEEALKSSMMSQCAEETAQREAPLEAAISSVTSATSTQEEVKAQRGFTATAADTGYVSPDRRAGMRAAADASRQIAGLPTMAGAGIESKVTEFEDAGKAENTSGEKAKKATIGPERFWEALRGGALEDENFDVLAAFRHCVACDKFYRPSKQGQSSIDRDTGCVHTPADKK